MITNSPWSISRLTPRTAVTELPFAERIGFGDFIKRDHRRYSLMAMAGSCRLILIGREQGGQVDAEQCQQQSRSDLEQQRETARAAGRGYPERP